MQHRITEPGNLLKEDGSLAQRGYSTRAVLTYNREQIKAPPWKIKEWDFYQVSNDEYCVQLTIGHVSYAGEVSLRFFEFGSGYRVDFSRMLILPFNRLNMPRSAEVGDLAYRSGTVEMAFEVFEGGRRLTARTPATRTAPPMEVDIRLHQPDPASIVMATPFDEDGRFFYYNHKINCMPATGFVRVGEREYRFRPENAFGLLDWGRGVWPYRHEWFWGNGSGYVGGKRFGFNIGYGFGNTSAATENILFYDGTAHKLSHVYFDLPGTGGLHGPENFHERRRAVRDGVHADLRPVHGNETAVRGHPLPPAVRQMERQSGARRRDGAGDSGFDGLRGACGEPLVRRR